MNIRAATDLLRFDFVLFDAPTARAVNGARQKCRNYLDLSAFMGSSKLWSDEMDRTEDPECETGNAQVGARRISAPRAGLHPDNSFAARTGNAILRKRAVNARS